MPSERDRPAGGGDGELDEALEDFDGEILAERAVIQQRSNERAGSTGNPIELPGGGGSGSGELPEGTPGGLPGDPDGDPAGTRDTAGYIPGGLPSEKNPQRAPPGPSGQVPEDIPDARDDDIIARQLREAAMNEPDPELREKLWEEYRRYKGA